MSMVRSETGVNNFLFFSLPSLSAGATLSCVLGGRNSHSNPRVPPPPRCPILLSKSMRNAGQLCQLARWQRVKSRASAVFMYDLPLLRTGERTSEAFSDESMKRERVREGGVPFDIDSNGRTYKWWDDSGGPSAHARAPATIPPRKRPQPQRQLHDSKGVQITCAT